MKTKTSDLVGVGRSRFGNGIFAKQHLPKGTQLFKITGRILNAEETVALGENECYTLQVDMDKYLLAGEPFLMSNHSCDPNCGIRPNLTFVTIKDVKKGEELLWDYSTSMLERRWTMQCECGAAGCREVIRDFDQIPTALQLRYLSQKIVLPFICRYISTKDIMDYSNMRQPFLVADVNSFGKSA
jgi:uncharacterized protein